MTTHAPGVRRGIPLALGAGVLFGMSAPLSKLIMTTMEPVALAGSLYLGAFLAASAGRLLGVTRRLHGTPLTRRDAPHVVAMVCVGGIVAPVLLMYGVRATTGFTASLLLNLEGVTTALIGWMFFGERVTPRVWGAVALMTMTGVLLSGMTTGTQTGILGPLLILGSAVGWGIDNNASARLSHADPLLLIGIKGCIAGLFSTLFSWGISGALPATRDFLGGLTVGAASYGISLVLFILSLKAMGAARTGAFFAVGPLAGALLSLAIFHGAFTWSMAAALALTAGSILLVAYDTVQQGASRG